MTVPFIRLPFVIPRAGGPVVNLTNAKPIFGLALEEDATIHVLLGPDATSLVDGFHGTSLALQGAAPTYSANSVNVSGVGKALQSVPDQLTQTLCMVVKRVNGVGTIYGGALRNTDNTGSSLHLASGSALLRSVIGSATPSVPWPAGIAVGDWAFIALSENNTTKDFIQHIGGNAPVLTNIPAGRSVSSSAGRVSIGNAYYNTGSYTSSAPDIAETILFPTAKTSAQLLEIYARSKQRMAARGITVK